LVVAWTLLIGLPGVMRVHCLDSETAADPAEIVAVEKIGLSVLAEREDKCLVTLPPQINPS
jgi:hypothetical protein